MLSNDDLTDAVNFLIQHRGRYPWHKLTGPNFELTEWEDAINTVRTGDYYRVIFRPEAEVKARKPSVTALNLEKDPAPVANGGSLVEPIDIIKC